MLQFLTVTNDELPVDIDDLSLWMENNRVKVKQIGTSLDSSPPIKLLDLMGGALVSPVVSKQFDLIKK